MTIGLVESRQIKVFSLTPLGDIIVRVYPLDEPRLGALQAFPFFLLPMTSGSFGPLRFLPCCFFFLATFLRSSAIAALRP